MAEIRTWRDWLKDQGVDRLVLLGHGRGGNQVAWYASDYPDDDFVSGLVLLAPMTRDPDRQAERYQRRYRQPLKPLLRRSYRLTANLQGRKLMSDVDFLTCADTQVTAESFFSYYGPDLRLDTPELLDLVHHRVLAIAGTRDPLAPDLPQRLGENAAQENVEVRLFPGAGHLFLGEHSERVVTETLRFLVTPR